MILQLGQRLGILPDDYIRSDFGSDVAAGLTTTVMLIPQAMAYALLAGLPPIVGLYASTVPLVAYALVGSSRQLAVGPAALDSLLTAATVGVIAQSGSDDYIAIATLLAAMVGGIQIVLGMLRGGFLIKFLTRPVISGFTSAAAIIIAVSQLRTIFGLNVPRSPTVFSELQSIARHLDDIHWLTFGIATLSIVLLSLLKKRAPKVPRALVVVGIGGAAAALFAWEQSGVPIIGAVPSELPRFTVPDFDSSIIIELIPGAISLALVAFMEAISVSTKIAADTGHQVDGNREFLALGFANVASGFFGGFPVAGGLSRTAVNADAGAKSKLAGLITAVSVAVALSLLTGLIYFIPKASLGAIIVAAVMGLFDGKEAMRLWKVSRSEFWVLLVTFLATLIFGIQQGIVIGIVLSQLVAMAGRRGGGGAN